MKLFGLSLVCAVLLAGSLFGLTGLFIAVLFFAFGALFALRVSEQEIKDAKGVVYDPNYGGMRLVKKERGAIKPLRRAGTPRQWKDEAERREFMAIFDEEMRANMERNAPGALDRLEAKDADERRRLIDGEWTLGEDDSHDAEAYMKHRHFAPNTPPEPLRIRTFAPPPDEAERRDWHQPRIRRWLPEQGQFEE